jgi:hypothetical protein
MFKNMNAIAVVTTHENGWYFVRTTDEILLVTDSNVWPGSITGGGAL